MVRTLSLTGHSGPKERPGPGRRRAKSDYFFIIHAKKGIMKSFFKHTSLHGGVRELVVLVLLLAFLNSSFLEETETVCGCGLLEHVS